MSGWTFLFNQGVGCAACRGEPVLCSEEVSAELGLLLEAGLTPKPAFRSAPSRPQPALFCVQDQGLCIIYLGAHEKPKLSATVGHGSITSGVLGREQNVVCSGQYPCECCELACVFIDDDCPPSSAQRVRCLACPTF